mmetsp:Transcript_32162/g.44081  ORF Transcript_32162/g.44081 Transcript_32162/m.44081 type:complete len:336 (+) Transcript_32162:16-1023(+)
METDVDPLLTAKAKEAGQKYQEFLDSCEEYHEKTNALLRTIDDEAEPPAIDYIIAALLFWCYPFYRRWRDHAKKKDPKKLETYQHAFHTWSSCDLTLNAYNFVALTYCKSNFQKGFKALCGIAIQLTFAVSISMYLFTPSRYIEMVDDDDLGSEIKETDSLIWQDAKEADLYIILITIASSVLILFSIRDEFRSALVSSRFFSWYPELYGSYWLMFLLEAWSSFGLSLYLFVLNAIVVLTSGDATDAVLNSVAVFFIAEVDEYLVSDYRGEETEDHLFCVELFRHYCYHNPEIGVDLDSLKNIVVSRRSHRRTFLRRQTGHYGIMASPTFSSGLN